MEKYQWNKKRTIKPLPYRTVYAFPFQFTKKHAIYAMYWKHLFEFLLFLSILPCVSFPSLFLLYPSSFSLGKYTRVFHLWNEASRNGRTKNKRIKDKFYSRILEGISPSPKEQRHGSRRCASKHSSFRFAYERERERERVTCMAIKWTTLTIHQFSISWNFNGSIYNIAASCATSTKGSRPS